jgi:nucleoside-diphosphate-sugar epimerase
MRILITGAAGNLGSFLAEYLLSSNHQLHLLIHQTELSFQADDYPNVTVFRGDLAKPDTLYQACQQVDCIVHFAGVLFAPRPERFLPITNVGYFKNLLDVARDSGVGKIILISFPHVEGETTPDHPASGTLDGQPDSVHAQTRLMAEKLLFEPDNRGPTAPVALRPGMIYGRGVLMIEAARWLMERRLLGIWPQSTWIHLLSLPDFLACTVAAIEGSQVSGIYNLGDDAPTTLQFFLDAFASQIGCPRPWRASRFLFPIAGSLTELGGWLLGKPAPLTRDFIKIGMASYVSNTDRMKAELLPKLKYPDLDSGLHLLKI